MFKSGLQLGLYSQNVRQKRELSVVGASTRCYRCGWCLIATGTDGAWCVYILHHGSIVCSRGQ